MLINLNCLWIISFSSVLSSIWRWFWLHSGAHGHGFLLHYITFLNQLNSTLLDTLFKYGEDTLLGTLKTTCSNLWMQATEILCLSNLHLTWLICDAYIKPYLRTLLFHLSPFIFFPCTLQISSKGPKIYLILRISCFFLVGWSLLFCVAVYVKNTTSRPCTHMKLSAETKISSIFFR